MKLKSSTILAFLPQQQNDELILNQALFFKQALGMRIFVLNILNVLSILPSKFRLKKVQKIKQSALLELTAFVKNTTQKEIPKDLILRIKFGKTVPTLINESRKGGYEFIIVDKGKRNLRGALTKNQVNKIVNRSYCPVLLLTREFQKYEINKIVIPVDIAQKTKKRLLWATLFAKKFNAKIQIVSALSANIDEKRSLAFSNAEKIKNMLNKRGVDCEVKIIKTQNRPAYKVVLEYIEKEKPGLVIIRSHQESVLERAHLGKFVSEIVHACNAPIFTVGYSKKSIPTDFEEG